MRRLHPIIHEPAHLRLSDEKLPPFPSPAQILHARARYLVQKRLVLPSLHSRRLEAQRLSAPPRSEPFVVRGDLRRHFREGGKGVRAAEDVGDGHGLHVVEGEAVVFAVR